MRRGLATKEDIASVVRSVDRPVNVVMGLRGVSSSLAELSKLGVKRISVGSALSRAALGAFLARPGKSANTARSLSQNEAASYQEVNAMFEAS